MMSGLVSSLVSGFLRGAIRAYQPAAGLHLLVDGSAGADVDIVGELYQQFPRALLLIVPLTYLTLFLLFRSVVLPQSLGPGHHRVHFHRGRGNPHLLHRSLPAP